MEATKASPREIPMAEAMALINGSDRIVWDYRSFAGLDPSPESPNKYVWTMILHVEVVKVGAPPPPENFPSSEEMHRYKEEHVEHLRAFALWEGK